MKPKEICDKDQLYFWKQQHCVEWKCSEEPSNILAVCNGNILGSVVFHQNLGFGCSEKHTTTPSTKAYRMLATLNKLVSQFLPEMKQRFAEVFPKSAVEKDVDGELQVVEKLEKLLPDYVTGWRSVTVVQHGHHERVGPHCVSRQIESEEWTRHEKQHFGHAYLSSSVVCFGRLGWSVRVLAWSLLALWRVSGWVAMPRRVVILHAGLMTRPSMTPSRRPMSTRVCVLQGQVFPFLVELYHFDSYPAIHNEYCDERDY